MNYGGNRGSQILMHYNDLSLRSPVKSLVPRSFIWLDPARNFHKANGNAFPRSWHQIRPARSSHFESEKNMGEGISEQVNPVGVKTFPSQSSGRDGEKYESISLPPR